MPQTLENIETNSCRVAGVPVLGVLFTPKAQQQPKKEVARKHDKLEESWINKWGAIVESKVCFTPQVKHENASKPSN